MYVEAVFLLCEDSRTCSGMCRNYLYFCVKTHFRISKTEMDNSGKETDCVCSKTTVRSCFGGSWYQKK